LWAVESRCWKIGTDLNEKLRNGRIRSHRFRFQQSPIGALNFSQDSGTIPLLSQNKNVQTEVSGRLEKVLDEQVFGLFIGKGGKNMFIKTNWLVKIQIRQFSDFGGSSLVVELPTEEEGAFFRGGPGSG